MSDPARFLNTFAQALTVMTLYPEGHPSRGKAFDAAYEELSGLPALSENPSFTFIEDEVVFGREPLRELKTWEWGRRLSEAGIQRLEFERRVSRDQFEGFLHEVLARLTLSIVDTSDNRQMRNLGIRFGAVGMLGLSEEEADTPATATLQVGLVEEVPDRLRQGEAARAQRQRMGLGESALAFEAGADRDRHELGELAQFVPGLRPMHTLAGIDHRPPRLHQHRRRFTHRVRVGTRPERP